MDEHGVAVARAVLLFHQRMNPQRHKNVLMMVEVHRRQGLTSRELVKIAGVRSGRGLHGVSKSMRKICDIIGVKPEDVFKIKRHENMLRWYTEEYFELAVEEYFGVQWDTIKVLV